MEAMRVLEYAFLKATMSNVPFETFNDTIVGDLGVPDGSFFNKTLVLIGFSEIISDILESKWATEVLGGTPVTFTRAGVRSVINANSITVPRVDYYQLASVVLNASGDGEVYLAYANAKTPKMLSFGDYVIRPGDIQFNLSDNMSNELATNLINVVFLQVTAEYTFDDCVLAFYEGDPATYGTLVGTIAVPDLEYKATGFYNTSKVTVNFPNLAGTHTITHVALYGVQGGSGVWLLANPLSRPVTINDLSNVVFEPGDLMVHMT